MLLPCSHPRDAIRTRDPSTTAKRVGDASTPAIDWALLWGQSLQSLAICLRASSDLLLLLLAGLDLHQAASAGDLDKMKALIAAGWEADSLNSDRETPLHWAAARGQTQAVMALLQAGADPTRTDRSGRTPSAQALENGHGEVGQALAQISQQFDERQGKKTSRKRYKPKLKTVPKSNTVLRVLMAAVEQQVVKNPDMQGSIFDLDEQEIRQVCECMESVKYHPGDPVFRKGYPGDFFFVVESGQCGVFLDNEAGEAVHTLGPGDGFGELALLNDSPRNATIKALTDAVLWRVDGKTLAAVKGE